MNTIEYLAAIGTTEKMFSKLYQAASSQYNLPEGSMWILYFLIFSDKDVTQQYIAERMLFPKQTINSATANLVEKGLVKLEKIEGTKKKKLSLTSTGTEFAENTVRHILSAECRAVEQMGTDKISQYVELFREFYECLRGEFADEGIIDA